MCEKCDSVEAYQDSLPGALGIPKERHEEMRSTFADLAMKYMFRGARASDLIEDIAKLTDWTEIERLYLSYRMGKIVEGLDASMGQSDVMPTIEPLLRQFDFQPKEAEDEGDDILDTDHIH